MATASAARGKAGVDFTSTDPQATLYDRALALLEQWNGVPFYRSMELEFVEGRLR